MQFSSGNPLPFPETATNSTYPVDLDYCLSESSLDFKHFVFCGSFWWNLDFLSKFPALPGLNET